MKRRAQTMFIELGRRLCSFAGRHMLAEPGLLILNFLRYVRDYAVYRFTVQNCNFQLSLRYCYPCLRDRSKTTPTDPTYLLQDSWAASHIASAKPARHYDVGSSVSSMSIIAQFVPTTMIDIRPITLAVPNLYFLEGSILHLPFADESIDSLSSLCVIEHVGLGRYGDALDPTGSEKAAHELQRVLRTHGNLFLSVPVDSGSRVYFNAHRTFTRDHVLSLFPRMDVIQEAYIYGSAVSEAYDASRGFGTGLYHFRKRAS